MKQFTPGKNLLALISNTNSEPNPFLRRAIQHLVTDNNNRRSNSTSYILTGMAMRWSFAVYIVSLAWTALDEWIYSALAVAGEIARRPFPYWLTSAALHSEVFFT
ncbi:hypothetical protein M6B38_228380 [Iris pallida]|uniref:Very-long-chain (3R)-3-hydroxyacyl-CoA dehydratase n=1 Tax=Iris pallida TaxID=29817 RepID=A0AAX6DSY0_IRIPA|nr:hypothetical protein M6B38_228380 [Iris pallida]